MHFFKAHLHTLSLPIAKTPSSNLVLIVSVILGIVTLLAIIGVCANCWRYQAVGNAFARNPAYPNVNY